MDKSLECRMQKLRDEIKVIQSTVDLKREEYDHLVSMKTIQGLKEEIDVLQSAIDFELETYGNWKESTWKELRMKWKEYDRLISIKIREAL